MRILVTADPELPVPPALYGGIERIVHLLVEELVRRGHEVGLVAHRESTCSVSQFFPWPGKQSQNPVDTVRNTTALLRSAARFRPDVVHSFSRLMYLSPLLPIRVPKIMSYQRHPGRRQVSMAAALGGDTLLFTACSHFVSDRGRTFGGKWRAIHNFVDTSKYAFQPSVSADAPLVFLSRVERLKGVHLAIAAARAAGRRLIIAGNHGESGAEAAYWREEILPQIGRGGIEYVGPVNDRQKNELLGNAAALIVPIQWDEPFGIVFAEALACGTPVISCPRGALSEIVQDGKHGYLASNVQSMTTAIERLGSIDRSECRRRAEECFSTAAIVDQYCSLYAEHVRR